MKSVLRGVILSVIGAMLCAGLVFTADRTLNDSRDKADNARFTATLFSGETVRPTHPNRVAPPTRDDIMQFLMAGWAPRGGPSTPAELATQLALDKALDEMGKNSNVAINLLNGVVNADLPDSDFFDSRRAQAYLALGQIFARGSDDALAPLKAARSFEKAVEFMNLEDRDAAVSALERSANLFESVGRQSDALRVRNRAVNFESGLSQAWITDAPVGASPNTPGEADSCDTALVATLPNWSEIMSIGPQPDHDWRSFSLAGGAGGTEGHRVTIETHETPETTDPDTDLTLWGDCPNTDELFFDDDSGEGFMSLMTPCLASNATYYLEVGGWIDTSSPSNFELTIDDAGAGSCFITAPDEFEPDDFLYGSSIPGIGCPTLDMDDDDGGCGGGKVQVCHVPPGNPANAHSICISESAVDTHLSQHGDTLGECPNGDVCERLQTQCRTIAPSGDVDLAQFNLGAESRQVSITTDDSVACGSGEGDNAAIVHALSDSNGGIFYATAASTSSLCLPGNQDFHVFATNLFAGATFPYAMTVDATAPCRFEAEPNSTCATAEDLGVVDVVGTRIAVGAFHTPFFDPFEPLGFFGTFSISDQDYFSFTIDDPAGCALGVQTTATGQQGRTDTELELFDDVGTCASSIGFDDDGGGVNWTSAINMVVPGGTYVARVTESAAFGTGLPYPYGLEVRCVPPPVDDQEPNDDPCAPFDIGELVGMVTLTGAISGPGIGGTTDRDYFGFTLTGDTIVSGTTTGPVAFDDTVLNIGYNTDPAGCAQLAICCNDDYNASAPGPYWSQTQVCLPAGDYVVGVQSWQQGAVIEEYSVTIANNGSCFADSVPENNTCVPEDVGGGCPFDP